MYRVTDINIKILVTNKNDAVFTVINKRGMTSTTNAEDIDEVKTEYARMSEYALMSEYVTE